MHHIYIKYICSDAKNFLKIQFLQLLGKNEKTDDFSSEDDDWPADGWSTPSPLEHPLLPLHLHQPPLEEPLLSSPLSAARSIRDVEDFICLTGEARAGRTRGFCLFVGFFLPFWEWTLFWLFLVVFVAGWKRGKLRESSLRLKTFPYGSPGWGQAVVSVREPSLRCSCCCCLEVRRRRSWTFILNP